MDNTGIVRKIDELGRIVIPKEIRNVLNIKDSENIEISVVGEKIVLQKYYKMNNIVDTIKKYLEIIEPLIDSYFIITDREKVVLTSSNQHSIVGNKINSTLLKLIDDRRQKINKNIEKISLFEGIIFESSYVILPIIIDADSIGSIICLKNSILKDTDVLSANILNYLIKKEY